MILTFPSDVLERLAEIARNEGSPPEETIRTAVGVWTLMSAGSVGRRRFSRCGMPCNDCAMKAKEAAHDDMVHC